MNTQTRSFTTGIAILLIGLFLILAVNLTAPRTARAAGVRYAAPTAQGSGNCSSWANACTLQTALAQAVSGDEIWVKAGEHSPCIGDQIARSLRRASACRGWPTVVGGLQHRRDRTGLSSCRRIGLEQIGWRSVFLPLVVRQRNGADRWTAGIP